MSNNDNNTATMWVIVICIAVFAAIVNMFSAGSNSGSAPPVNRNSAEHKYVTERFRQEGYGAEESRQAADAIMKFHNAQQNR